VSGNYWTQHDGVFENNGLDTEQQQLQVRRPLVSLLLNSTAVSVLTPVNWAPGDPCVVDPSLPEEELKEKFGKHTDVTMRSGRNYLKFVVRGPSCRIHGCIILCRMILLEAESVLFRGQDFLRPFLESAPELR